MIRASVLLIATAILTRGAPQYGAARQTDLPASERALEENLKSHPSAEAWEKLGLVRHLQNKFDAAIPAFREAVRLNPSLWTSHLFLGIDLYRTNQFAEAVSSVERAERLAPKQHPGRDDLDYWLAATRIAMKKPLAGLSALERLLQRNPSHVDGLELAVRTYADLSTAAWNEVAEKNFETAAGYEVHGYALEEEGNLDGAIAAFRQSQSLQPGRPGPALAIGRILLFQGKPQEALATLQSVTTSTDTAPEACYFSGLAAIQLGRNAEAVSFLEKASRWPERNPEASLALAQVYLALNEPLKAAGAAKQAISANPSSRAAHDLSIAALTKAGLTKDVEAEQRRWSERKH